MSMPSRESSFLSSEEKGEKRKQDKEREGKEERERKREEGKDRSSCPLPDLSV